MATPNLSERFSDGYKQGYRDALKAQWSVHRKDTLTGGSLWHTDVVEHQLKQIRNASFLTRLYFLFTRSI